MFVGPLPRELKPPGGRVPARRPRGRASPRTSLNPERRVPARAPQAPACPRTRALFAADTPRFAEPLSSLDRSPRCAALLAAPFSSPRCAARRRYAADTAPPAALLATVALLHIPLVGIASLHAQSPRSAQQRHSNGTGVQQTPRQWNRRAITPQQWNRQAITPQQRHHGPPADAYEPLAKRTSQALHPDLGC